MRLEPFASNTPQQRRYVLAQAHVTAPVSQICSLPYPRTRLGLVEQSLPPLQYGWPPTPAILHGDQELKMCPSGRVRDGYDNSSIPQVYHIGAVYRDMTDNHNQELDTIETPCHQSAKPSHFTTLLVGKGEGCLGARHLSSSIRGSTNKPRS